VNLLQRVSMKGTSSTILSPLSVSIALAMVYAGAKNKTAEEIDQLLANGAPESEVHEFFGQLQKTIQQRNQNGYTLEMANKVYVKDKFPVLEAFTASIQRNYGVGTFESVDFTQNAATAEKINHFVANATRDKIHDLISPDSLNDETRLVLINAIYFKGTWAEKFDKRQTQKQPFYASDGASGKELDMMHKTAKFIYHEDEELQLLGMPYVREEVRMFVLLPRERFGLGKLLATMSGKRLLDVQRNGYKRKVQVTLPKFKLESTHQLIDPLKKLGVIRAFGSSADFTGITDKEPLLISQAIQKAFIEVNEEGTEAAAATAIGVSLAMAGMVEPPTPSFVADRPFAAFLCTRDDGNILFAAVFHG